MTTSHHDGRTVAPLTAPPLPPALSAEGGQVASTDGDAEPARSSLERLAAFRERLLPTPPQLPDTQLRPAAVLVPVVEADGELHLLFTLRTETVRVHKGQVCFPGGGWHDDDLDLLHTALRETHEELGVPAESIEVLGYLKPLPTISDYCVLPVVGKLDWPLHLVPSPDEIAEVFTVPIATLLDPASCTLEEREHRGRRYYPVYSFRGGAHRVWGITGFVVADLLRTIYAWEPLP